MTQFVFETRLYYAQTVNYLLYIKVTQSDSI